MKIKHIICLLGALTGLLFASQAAAQEATDESGLFTAVAPDAMIVLAHARGQASTRIPSSAPSAA